MRTRAWTLQPICTTATKITAITPRRQSAWTPSNGEDPQAGAPSYVKVSSSRPPSLRLNSQEFASRAPQLKSHSDAPFASSPKIFANEQDNRHREKKRKRLKSKRKERKAGLNWETEWRRGRRGRRCLERKVQIDAGTNVFSAHSVYRACSRPDDIQTFGHDRMKTVQRLLLWDVLVKRLGSANLIHAGKLYY